MSFKMACDFGLKILNYWNILKYIVRVDVYFKSDQFYE